MLAHFHFTKNTFALHFLFKRTKSLLDVVITYNYLDDSNHPFLKVYYIIMVNNSNKGLSRDAVFEKHKVHFIEISTPTLPQRPKRPNINKLRHKHWGLKGMSNRRTTTLDNKYTQTSGRIYINGMQALVRIPLMQRWIDQARGLNTAVFISGYRGSPLGGYDMALRAAQTHLDQHNIRFVPGVNEDLGATAVWGSQQLNLGPGAQYDGVTGIWYGKGPGVDRSNDVLKHANAAGTSRYGGVLALAGDDHACKSSTLPHQSEQAFIHCFIPMLHPTGIEDALELGLHGIAMSRYSGCWTGFKVISDFADSSASVDSNPFDIEFITPQDFDLPPTGLNIRWYDAPLDQEERLLTWKLPAVKAYARANQLNKVTLGGPGRKRLGLIATGKAYQDTRQALQDMGISDARAIELGLTLYKVALVWPLEEHGILSLAQECDALLVIEEKRGVIEDQVKRILYNMPADQRPIIIGKTDEQGGPLLPETFELSPGQIGSAIAKRLKHISIDTSSMERRLQTIRQSMELRKNPAEVVRMPWYCSGCPHNTSTVVPEGSRALAGIGCHYMAMWMDRDTVMFTQMGGEGTPWIGQAPFTSEKHVFANLGDGTYFHSGLLAIRAAVAAKVNITYKILYNDAVAMTGGQSVDGDLSVADVAAQVRAEGVQTIVIVSDEPEKYGSTKIFPAGTRVQHRDDLDLIQRQLRETTGTSVLIYDQTCAAEKRRRRKRKLMVDPAKRTLINERVCEGCGDCGDKSNCLSIEPVDTEFGRKRQINQSTCNKDFSCVKGFCPSFVTVYGGALRKPAPVSGDDAQFANLPEPILPSIDQRPMGMLVTGIGGTGVVTIGAIVAMAAHLENKGASTMDQTGLAQKGGAVTSHVHIAKSPAHINTVRLGAASADVVLGCDLLVTADGDSLSKINPGETRIVLNVYETPTGDFTRNPDWKIATESMANGIARYCGPENIDRLNATAIATALLGDSIATNMFMLGYAWQKGYIPLAYQSIMQALDLNAVAIEMNQRAFEWGRRAAHDLQAVLNIALPPENKPTGDRHRVLSQSLEEIIERRTQSLRDYQNDAYARKYRLLVDKALTAEKALIGKPGAFTEAVARYYYKLMAYKDEYEVARLHTDGQFLDQIKRTFDGDYKIKFNMAPPLFSKRDPVTGEPRKTEFGPWMLPILRVLAKMRFLRGTAFDLFGYSKERKTERQLIIEYQQTITALLRSLKTENLELATQIATIPEHIRGYGHVKERHLEQAKARQVELLKAFDD